MEGEGAAEDQEGQRREREVSWWGPILNAETVVCDVGLWGPIIEGAPSLDV